MSVERELGEFSSQARLTRGEVKQRYAEAWKGELERVRRERDPYLSIYDAVVAKELSRKDRIGFPPLAMAMCPEDVRGDIDTSNPERFNERFIELPVQPTDHWIQQLHWGLHNLGLLIAAVVGWYQGFAGFFVIYLTSVVLALVSKQVLGAREGQVVGGTRFNRQAQLVHHMDHAGNVAHIPWRQVRPVVQVGAVNGLTLLAPRPKPEYVFAEAAVEQGGQYHSPDDTSGPYWIPFAMSPRDAGIDGGLIRLDFIRRYMEHGLDAIEPDWNLIEELEQESRSLGSASGWRRGIHLVFVYPIRTMLYWACLGPLYDKRVKNKAQNTRWPQEVEDLCGSNPDLTGLDIRPVSTQLRRFYRLKWPACEVVDEAGRPI